MSKNSWTSPHIIRALKSMGKNVYITAGVFVISFSIFHVGGSLYVSLLGSHSVTFLNEGIDKDLSYLKKQGDEVSQNIDVIQYLLAGDSKNLFDTIQRETNDRGVGQMTITNAEGAVVSRTTNPNKSGDNIFFTNPLGRAVAEGKSVESIESPVSYSSRQIYLGSGRPITFNGKMIGSLFSNYFANDSYATRFKNMYLPENVQVVFYHKDFGVYGNSFQDKEIQKLINSYFNSGSEWIKNEGTEKTVSFNGKDFYLVENVIFPGLEKSPGGALLFIPRKDISHSLNIILAILTVATFVGLASRQHMRCPKEERGWKYYVLLVIACIPVFVLSYLALYIQSVGYLKIQKVPYPLYNSTLRIQPEFGLYNIGFDQKFSVVTDTGDEAINAVKVKLLFDPRDVDVKSLETSSSTCSYVIESAIDNTNGTLDFACVLIKPNGEVGAFTIVDIVASPKKSGTFSFSFDNNETEVLANDGLGTNVLRMSQGSTFQSEEFWATTTLANGTSMTITSPSILVFSPTHPNRNRWYSGATARFVWRNQSDTIYKYSLDTAENGIPTKEHTTQLGTVEMNIPGDGIFFFHIQDIAGGPVTTYRIQSDSTPPSIVSMKLSENEVEAGDVVRFSFSADDSGSGVQNNYYVDLGDHLFLPTGSSLFVPFLIPGEQKIVLRVYDGAGNYSEAKKTVQVKEKGYSQ